MNKIEKIIYDALKKHPQIKLFVRDAYQNVMDLIPDKPNYTINDVKVFEGFFWGFHDVSPISSDEQHMLGCKLNIPLRMPQPSEPLSIGYWDIDFKDFHIDAFKLNHNVTCYGYSISIDRAGRFDSNRAKELNIPLEIF